MKTYFMSFLAFSQLTFPFIFSLSVKSLKNSPYSGVKVCQFKIENSVLHCLTKTSSNALGRGEGTVGVVLAFSKASSLCGQ